MMNQNKPKCIHYVSHWWLEDQMRAIAQQAAVHGWFLDFQMCLDNQFPENWRGDGIITPLSCDYEGLAEFLRQTDCPTVSLNQDLSRIGIPCVDVDMEAVGLLAATHFMERNFRSFAVYSPGCYPPIRTAGRAFGEAVAANGFSTDYLYWQDERGQTQDSRENRHTWLRRKLSRYPGPLAVLALEALSHVEIIEAAMAESLAIPEQVAVLALHDIALFRESTTIPLSCITHDFENHARVACDLLAGMMAGDAPPETPILLDPTGIVTRKSTDTIAARKPEVATTVRYMLEYFAEPIEIADLVRISGLCRTRLFEEFDADLGQPPHAILNRIRFDRAKQMLRESDEKIRVVAERCGFGASINLYRHFKQRLNTTPADYRNEKGCHNSAGTFSYSPHSYS